MADDIIRIRRDTLANWTSVNPVLAIGEISYDTTGDAIRIGDGSTVWLSLPEIASTTTPAPINATYITQVANGTLTNEFALGSLATGILKNTATSGVLSIAVGADLPAHNHAASEITSGVLAVARLGSGTPTALTVLLGDGSWGSVPAHVHSAADITSGTVDTARLGTGTASSSTVLLGSQAYSTLGVNFLSDVTITGLANLDLLQYESATGQWTNQTIAYCNLAPAAAKYIVQEVTTGLTAEQSLGALTTGIVKNTVTGATGVLSTAVGADLPSHTHALSDLTVSGASNNQVPAWSGSAWVPVTPAAAVSDGDKGDITVSSSGTVWNIDAATVGLTELSATGTPTSANFLRGDNAWSTGVLVTDGDKGDITVSATGATWAIDALAVSMAKINATGTPGSGNFLRGDGVWRDGFLIQDSDRGDITVSASGATWTIDAATVGISKLSATGTPSASTFLRGDNTWVTPAAVLADAGYGSITVSSSGTVFSIAAATIGLTELSATGTKSASTYLRGDNTWAAVIGLSDGDKGDITVSSSGTVWNIDAGVVTTTELGGDITNAGKALLDDADASAQRTTLGLGALATLADAPALTLTGTVLNSAIVTSSLTSVGTLAALTVTAPIAGSVTGNAATVTTNANLTGHITSSGNASSLGAFTSLELKTALSDETGSGAAVFATSPTLVTPILGTPTSGNLSNCTNLPSHTHALADLVTTGTAGATNFLRGDGAWTTGILVSDGDKGDITVSSSGTVWNIDAATVGLTELSATGTPSGSNFLRGDNTWASPTTVLADADYGDITVSSSGTVWNIDAATVGLTELSATGTPSGSNFLRGDNTWAAASGSVSDGDKGDITVSSSGTVWNIDAATVGVTELSASGTASSSTFLRGDNAWSDITFGDGSAAAPSITHTGDTDTGMYFDATGNKIYMATAGTLAMTIGASQGVTLATNLIVSGNTATTGYTTTTGITYVAAGTAALPSITRTADTDTGIWFDTNNVSLTTAGVNALTIGSTQRATFSGALDTPHGKFEVSVTPFSGYFDHPRGNGILNTAVQSTTPSTSFAVPYIPQKTITISGIGAYTSSAVVGATCSLAIYASGSNGYPSGTAAMHCSAALTASAASTAISSSYSTTLYAGTQYWLVFNTPNSTFPSMRAYGSTALPRIKLTGTDIGGHSYISWGQTIATSRNFTTTPVTSAETFGGAATCIVYVIVA